MFWSQSLHIQVQYILGQDILYLAQNLKTRQTDIQISNPYLLTAKSLMKCNHSLYVNGGNST